jgi:hypothetical protein
MLHVRVNVPAVPAMLEALAEGLVLFNVELIKHALERGVQLPYILDTNLVYRNEPVGREWWESASDLLHVVTDRSGDCEDLSSYHAAWCRVFDDDHASVRVFENPSGSLHAVVEHEDGTIEDVSRELLIAESQRTGISARDLAKKTTTDTRSTS